MKKRSENRVFFDGHKYKDVVKYQKIFLEEMKSLLSYLIEFEENSIIYPINISMTVQKNQIDDIFS